MVLAGLYFGLKNIERSWKSLSLKPAELFRLSLPIALFVTTVAAIMIVFFVN
jgi:hypothetical protein